ncbi:hypothetical protein DL93DRAFT_2076960, partial [Clavulina sp. PMI_390]
ILIVPVGHSGLNGTLMIRGPKADYDQWAEWGNEGWAWKDVLPLFKKVILSLSNTSSTPAILIPYPLV